MPSSAATLAALRPLARHSSSASAYTLSCSSPCFELASLTVSSCGLSLGFDPKPTVRQIRATLVLTFDTKSTHFGWRRRLETCVHEPISKRPAIHFKLTVV